MGSRFESDMSLHHRHQAFTNGQINLGSAMLQPGYDRWPTRHSEDMAAEHDQMPKMMPFSDGVFPKFHKSDALREAMVNAHPVHLEPTRYKEHLARLQHQVPSSHPRPGALPYAHLYQEELLSCETYPAADQWRIRTTKANGDQYDGTWEDGKPHGDGTYTYANGNRYTGEFSTGEPHGTGVAVNSNGDTYDGQWVHSMRQGHGTEAYTSGHKYDGEWMASKRCGHGTMCYADRSQYVGEWLDNLMHGRGMHSIPGGTTYEGEWKSSREHGFGIQTTADGTTWEGPWKGGERAGQFIVTLPNGTSYHSVWNGSEEQTLGVYTNPRWERELRVQMGESKVSDPQGLNIRDTARRFRSEDAWHRSQGRSKEERYGARGAIHDLLEYTPASDSVKSFDPQLAADTTSDQIKCDVYAMKHWG